MAYTEYMYCWSCGYKFLRDEKLTRQSECPKCMSPLRCCRQCRHFSPGSYNDCDEPEADYSGENEAVNFCSYWRPASAPIPAHAKLGRTSKDDAKKRWDDLFKD